MEKEKDLYTYVLDICRRSTLKYCGLKIVPSLSAARELMKHGKTLEDVVFLLENGCNAPRRRKRGTVEKWLDRGKKTFNAVVAKDYDEREKEEVWVLIHFGKFTRRRGSLK